MTAPSVRIAFAIAPSVRMASLALCLLGLMSNISQAEEWSRFRGPNGSGVGEAKGLPAKFDDTNTVWKTPVGHGWSSPVVWKDKLFLTEETSAGKRAVLCLNIRDGKEVWKYEVDYAEHKKHELNSFASTTPFVDEQRIYVTWANGNNVEALALDQTGKLVWRNEHVADYVHEHGYGASPVVADGILIVRSEFLMEKEGKPLATSEQLGWKNVIVGIDAATGKQVWKNELPNSLNSFGTPTVRDVNGAHEFILANTTSGFMGLDTKTGKTNWQHNPGFKQRSVGSYVLKDNVIFSSLGSGGGGSESAVLKLGTSPGVKPEIAYALTKHLPYVPTPLLLGERLYMVNDGGLLACVDWKTGQEIYYERLTAEESGATKPKGKGGKGGGARFFSSPVAADGKIFCASQTGKLVVVKAGDKFEILGSNDLDAPINATPAIAANHLFVRTDKTLWCFGAKPRLP